MGACQKSWRFMNRWNMACGCSHGHGVECVQFVDVILVRSSDRTKEADTKLNDPSWDDISQRSLSATHIPQLSKNVANRSMMGWSVDSVFRSGGRQS